MHASSLCVSQAFQSQASEKVKYLWYLAVACDQAGGRGTVNALSVSRKMWEQSSTPPQENGQLFVTAAVIVARTSI